MMMTVHQWVKYANIYTTYELTGINPGVMYTDNSRTNDENDADNNDATDQLH